nr:Unknown Function [uncultured bacterium]
MQSLLDAPRTDLRSTINVCARIQCPYFQQDFASFQGCARYCNPGHCHLTSVFAFVSEPHGLFAANESDLHSVKRANDGWIAKDKASQRSIRYGGRNNKSSPPKNRKTKTFDAQVLTADNDGIPPINFPSDEISFKPISLSLLNSIHFEEY